MTVYIDIDKILLTPINHVSYILERLKKVLEDSIPGDVIEVGCYTGATSIILKEVCDRYSKTFHVYD